MQKVDYFRNKKFLIVHGTADGNVRPVVLLVCVRLLEYDTIRYYVDLYVHRSLTNI